MRDVLSPAAALKEQGLQVCMRRDEGRKGWNKQQDRWMKESQGWALQLLTSHGTLILVYEILEVL